MRKIVANAGGEPSLVVNALRAGKGNYGFNVANDTCRDMRDWQPGPDQVDPHRTAKRCVCRGLTAKAMVAEATKDETPAPGGGMGRMSGMDM